MEAANDTHEAVARLLDEIDRAANPERAAAAFLALICLGLIVGTLFVMGTYIGVS